MAIAIGGDLRRDGATAPLSNLTLRRESSRNAQSADHEDTDASRDDVTAKRMWIGFAVLSVLLLAYLISLLVRTPAQQWTWLDGWTICAIEVVASSMCIVRGLNKHPGRTAPLALGFALLSWTHRRRAS